MADNLSPTLARFFAVPDHGIVALDGPDATAFAHAQFANDVAALAPGHWQWNAWLTPKGRVIAVFALVKASDDKLLLVLPDHPAELFAEQLRRFVFRRKLQIAVPADLRVSAAFSPPALARNAQIGVLEDGLELDFGADGGGRTLRLSRSLAAGDGDGDDEALAQRWQAFDLRHGLPRLPSAQREQWTPQQLSLDRLRAYSVKKGCYPGQEIVARTHFLGKAKRGLALFRARMPLRAGAAVSDGARDIGTIVSASADGALALAVLPLDREPLPLSCGGSGLDEIPLQEGLAR
ncbi:YgfZ/GcvT domain-containing protein [Pseudoxanthomonas wuyuanensis]|uniref:CAF17-like 4Fe-4S cluster assembly/insertion protein YgfZ n=1 Tax=Pseudoxanthomonas wuyuanensis TaxID=1073196 RepID=UPI0015968D5B|nr:folate-binding protein YgfZ [Pseudoxanthomonas wuyuanensis]